MSGSKNYFEEFSQTWPKEVLAKPVMGERGQKNLPSGTEGGENLDLERHYEHKQHTFDHFAKQPSNTKPIMPSARYGISRTALCP